jgi:pimeloyl-ACP methyl ester carboxylesterase
VSYGGLVATAFAARYPERTAGLVLVSALPVEWKPDARVRFYIRRPRLLMPVFMVASLRLYREIGAATPGLLNGAAAALRHAFTVLSHMFSPTRMARRVRLIESLNFSLAPGSISAPALIVTGDARLDRVVPVAMTEQYLRILPGAARVTLDRTGHLGLITRPSEFAGAVSPFVARAVAPAPRRTAAPGEPLRDRHGVHLRDTIPGTIERKRVG